MLQYLAVEINTEKLLRSGETYQENVLIENKMA